MSQTIFKLSLQTDRDLNGQRLIDLGAPSALTDAATKQYVDTVAQGLDPKDSVRAATTVNGNLSTAFDNGSDVDGVTLATGDRILIKNQDTGSQNGIYVVEASGAPTRADDMAAGSEAAGVYVFVEEGDTNADSGWVCTNNSGSDSVGSDALTFSQFSGAGQITAGKGLSKTGNTLDVDVGDSSLSFSATQLQVKLNSENMEVTNDGIRVKDNSIDKYNLTTDIAGSGLIGGNGDPISIGEENGITVTASGIAVDESEVDHDQLLNFVANEHIDWTNTGENLYTTGNIEGDTVSASNLAVENNIVAGGNITGAAFFGDGANLTNLPTVGAADTVAFVAKTSSVGVTIPAGQAVYIKEYDGTYIVGEADNDVLSKLPSIGVASLDIGSSIGLGGKVVTSGPIDSLDTDSWDVGDPLYVGEDGSLTNVKPTGETNKIQKIGQVAKKDASTGRIQVFGAGRTNDVPALDAGNFWKGIGAGSAVTVNFTEASQDAIGSALTDSTTIDFTYDDGAGTITADVINDSIDKTKINANIAGSGLSQEAGGEISVNVTGALEISGDNVQVSDDGITGAMINAAVAGSGLGQDPSDNLKVNVDDATLEISSDNVQVKNAGITSAKIAAAVAGSGIAGGNGTELYVDFVRETLALTGNSVVTSQAFVADSEMIFLNGQLTEEGAGDDYQTSGQTITFNYDVSGQKIIAWYLV